MKQQLNLFGKFLDMATRTKIPAFIGTKIGKSAKGARVGVFGAPHGTPYRGIDNRVHAGSADAYRRAMADDADWGSSYDFDFGGTLVPPDFKAVDLGNLPTRSADGRGNRKKIEAQTRKILSEGAVPFMFGGDDSVPIPFIEGFSGGPPITIVQIDAHIDWRDERLSERMGFSSTMRRASEQAHVARIVQAGARGIGTARQEEVDTALKWGARLIPGRQIHEQGVEAVLQHIEPHSHCVVSLDLDVLDISTMPAVVYPTPNGLGTVQLSALLAGVAAKARIAGFAMVEFVPKRDWNGTSTYIAGRIAAQMMGHVARQKPAT
jgi:agmatinase